MVTSIFRPGFHVGEKQLNKFLFFRLDPKLPIVTHSFFKAGTGNCLFFIASVIGIALANKRQPALSKRLPLLQYMRVDLPIINASSLTTFKHIQDSSVGVFHRKYLNLSSLVGERSVYFAGYLQSYKYFQAYQEEIRRQFRFVPRIADEARHLIRNATTGTATTDRPVNYVNGKISTDSIH